MEQTQKGLGTRKRKLNKPKKLILETNTVDKLYKRTGQQLEQGSSSNNTAYLLNKAKRPKHTILSDVLVPTAIHPSNCVQQKQEPTAETSIPESLSEFLDVELLKLSNGLACSNNVLQFSDEDFVRASGFIETAPIDRYENMQHDAEEDYIPVFNQSVLDVYNVIKSLPIDEEINLQYISGCKYTSNEDILFNKDLNTTSSETYPATTSINILPEDEHEMEYKDDELHNEFESNNHRLARNVDIFETNNDEDDDETRSESTSVKTLINNDSDDFEDELEIFEAALILLDLKHSRC